MRLVADLRLVVHSSERTSLAGRTETAVRTGTGRSRCHSQSATSPALRSIGLVWLLRLDATNRRPASAAFWYSLIESDQLADGNGMVHDNSGPNTECMSVSISVDLPFAPLPNKIQSACSVVSPVNE